jgi:hypothetical protein
MRAGGQARRRRPPCASLTRWRRWRRCHSRAWPNKRRPRLAVGVCSEAGEDSGHSVCALRAAHDPSCQSLPTPPPSLPPASSQHAGLLPTLLVFQRRPPLPRALDRVPLLTLPSLCLACHCCHCCQTAHSLPLATRCTLLLTLVLTLFDRPLLLPLSHSPLTCCEPAPTGSTPNQIQNHHTSASVF